MRSFFVLCVCFLFSNVSSAQSRFDEVNRHIIYQEYDSALYKIRSIESPQHLENLFSVIYNFATYKDYSQFIESSNFITRNDFQNLVYFIEKRVKKPISRHEVNLDFVVLQTQIIDTKANKLELHDASEHSDMLYLYLNEIKNKEGNDFERALLYVQNFDALLGVIEKDLNKLNDAEKNMNRALDLGDTVLHLRYAALMSELFIVQGDLEGYIRFFSEKLELAKNLDLNKSAYYKVVERLLDGLIYSHSTNYNKIESLIDELIGATNSKYDGYTILIRYLKKISSKPEEMHRILNKYGFNDAVSMILELKTGIHSYLQNDDLANFHFDSARLLFELEEYELCMELMYDMVRITRQTYSRDLTSTLADYKIREVERENSLLLIQEKEKNKLYLTLGITVFVSLIFTIFLSIKLQARTNVLFKRNQEKENLLLEKDLLMQEIHHRVKNNFELVSTLLELQSYEVDNQEVKEKLYEGQARIQSLSLIHNKLYESNQSTSVDMQQYIQELSELVLKSANFDHKVRLNINANLVHLDIDTTVPLGLIINELLTNSCKYAFPDAMGAEIRITLIVAEDGFYKLHYQEIGTQPKEKTNSETKTGLGKVLIKNLVKQLQGRLVSDFTHGANYEIWFKDKLSRKKTA